MRKYFLILLLGAGISACEIDKVELQDCERQTVEFTATPVLHPDWDAYCCNFHVQMKYSAQFFQELQAYAAEDRKSCGDFEIFVFDEVGAKDGSVTRGFDSFKGSVSLSLPNFQYTLTDTDNNYVPDNLTLPSFTTLEINDGDVLLINFGNTAVTYSIQ